MSKVTNWGIIGLGKIAHKFAHDLNLVPQAHIKAVASRTASKARLFAEQYGAERHYGSYQELLSDPEVEVVYIATPHALHLENGLQCLQNGKHVLCEKPMGLNESEVQRMVDEARQRKLFLMEGIWTRFMPSIAKLLELLNEGVIGEVQAIYADFGFDAPYDPKGRLFNKKLGGGALMDIGIYPAYLAQLILGTPESISATSRYSASGVDAHTAMLFKYEGGAIASLESCLDHHRPTEAHIYGSRGAIRLHRLFHQSKTLDLTVDGKTQSFALPYSGKGYVHEIEEVQHCLQQAWTESKALPLSESLKLARLLDRVKQEVGLHY